jgi:hypothetical protein
MLNQKFVLVTNIFFHPDKNIIIIEDLDQNHILNILGHSLYLNDIFIADISFTSEFFIEKKTKRTNERAFECKQNLNQLKEIDLTVNTLRLYIR